MKIIEHEEPVLKRPVFLCDTPLHEKLNNCALLKHMNKTFSCLFCGRAGSGKTSLLTALLQTPSGGKRHKCQASFYKCFHRVYLFMPSYSGDSMKDNIFDKLPQEQRFGLPTIENLNHLRGEIEENAKNKMRSLVIFDDVQEAYNDTHVFDVMLGLLSNMRHLGASSIIVAQNFIMVPKQIRTSCTDAFLFGCPETELEDIKKALFSMPKRKFEELIQYYETVRKTDEHAFLYVHKKHTIFVNWNEVELE